MAWQVAYDAPRRIVDVTYRGHVTSEDIRACVARVIEIMRAESTNLVYMELGGVTRIDAGTVDIVSLPDLYRSLGLEGCDVLGFLGSFYAYEGLELLVEALPALLEKRPRLRLLLVGEGPREESLRRRVRDLGLADKVVFPGRVPHSEVRRYYDLVDVLVYPRFPMRLTETVTPLKPLEAMAMGKLLVASDVGGHRELVRDAETGLLFEAGSAPDLARKVLLALEDEELKRRIPICARRFVEEERTWARGVARYRPLYERLTKDRARV